MSLIVVGLNHRTVPVELLERMTVPEVVLPKALHDLAAREHLLETVVLSTCNRTEIYAVCTRFHAAVGDVADFLAAYSGADPDDFADHLYTYYDDAAVTHLFSVAAGLDSMIVGESEILGQVRDAWDVAAREGSAFAVARRSSSGTRSSRASACAPRPGIGRHPVSIPSAAVTVAAERLGTLDGAKRARGRRGPDGPRPRDRRCGRAASARSSVANRTPERARRAGRARSAAKRSRCTTTRRHARRCRRAADLDRRPTKCSSSGRRSRWSWRAATVGRC